MVGVVRCACSAPVSSFALLRPPDRTTALATSKEQVAFFQRYVPLAVIIKGRTASRVWRDGLGVQPRRGTHFCDHFRDKQWQCNAGHDRSSTSVEQQLAGAEDSVKASPSCFRRGVVTHTLALALLVGTGRGDALAEEVSSSSIPTFSGTGTPPATSSGSTTDSWYRYKGRGFWVKVPPDFEDLQEPEDVPEDESSLYGQRAKEKPYAARFASVDRQEVLSIVVRPVSQYKLGFLEAQDITALGDVEEAARIFVPVGGRIIGTRSLVTEGAQGSRLYYLYEFTTQEKRVALVASAASGQLYVAAAVAPRERWRTCAAKLRSAALSFSVR